MIYKEDLSLTIKFGGRWDQKHTIIYPTWKDIAGVIYGKLTNKPKALIWESLNVKNALMDEGEQDILELFFRNNNLLAASPFFFGLATGAVPAETATLATITEVSGSGYGRIAVVRGTTDWGATALDAGDYQTTSLTKTFNATGTWTTADYLFLCDVVSGSAGDLLATVALTAARTLLTGESLQVSMKVKLQ